MEFTFQPSPWPLFFEAPFLFPSFITPENYVHWTETPESHIYTADLPGLRKEEIRVEVEDNKFLIIRTEQATNEEEEEEETRPERPFMRKFRLPDMIDVGSISAAYEDGVLTVNVPRSSSRRHFYIDPADLPDRHEILAPAA